MPHYSPPLKEFVYPVPVCQPEANLNNVLSIFRHLNCQVLAIPSATGWGIITSASLLSLVNKSCWDEKTAFGTRNADRRQKVTEQSLLEVRAAIESVIINREDTKLDDFLSRGQSNDWLTKEKVCLIVDRQGTLQGRLDRNKIIEYLAQKPRLRESVKTNFSPIDSLEQIALPAKIEAANGRIVRANQLWLDLHLNNLQTASESAVSVSEAEFQEIMQSSIEPRGVSKPRADVRVGNFPRPYSLGVELEQTADWNYVKIPLAAPLQTTEIKDLQYLVLATITLQKKEHNIEQVAAAPEMASERILATVSHELKSPLTGILGLSSLLQGQKLGSLNQRQLRYVALIYRSGKKMMNIVDRLLRLNSLITEQSSETELINLEFLCRQLYQEAVTKLRATEDNCHLAPQIERTQLEIELGSEIAIANRSLLSAILSHLLLEAFEIGEFEPPKITIEGRGGATKIEIANQKNLPLVNLGLNWMMAECLSKGVHGRMSYSTSSSGCQFTLLLPKNKSDRTQSLSKTTTATQTSANKDNTNLTILCLYPELDVIDPLVNPSYNPNFDLKSWSDEYERQSKHQHRIIEADSLEQAHNLARIWRLDAIVLNGYQIALPDFYLRSLQSYEHLANLPLITLDARTTEAANQIEGLDIYPCLLPVQQSNIDDLIQVIKIAIES